MVSRSTSRHCSIAVSKERHPNAPFRDAMRVRKRVTEVIIVMAWARISCGMLCLLLR